MEQKTIIQSISSLLLCVFLQVIDTNATANFREDAKISTNLYEQTNINYDLPQSFDVYIPVSLITQSSDSNVDNIPSDIIESLDESLFIGYGDYLQAFYGLYSETGFVITKLQKCLSSARLFFQLALKDNKKIYLFESDKPDAKVMTLEFGEYSVKITIDSASKVSLRSNSREIRYVLMNSEWNLIVPSATSDEGSNKMRKAHSVSQNDLLDYFCADLESEHEHIHCEIKKSSRTSDIKSSDFESLENFIKRQSHK